MKKHKILISVACLMLLGILVYPHAARSVEANNIEKALPTIEKYMTKEIVNLESRLQSFHNSILTQQNSEIVKATIDTFLRENLTTELDTGYASKVAAEPSKTDTKLPITNIVVIANLTKHDKIDILATGMLKVDLSTILKGYKALYDNVPMISDVYRAQDGMQYFYYIIHDKKLDIATLYEVPVSFYAHNIMQLLPPDTQGKIVAAFVPKEGTPDGNILYSNENYKLTYYLEETETSQ